jgi:glyoxylase-like metal-dependent hydrolase (beta-lactamase superfamily II)
MKITFMECGHCVSKENMMLKGAGKEKVKIPVLVGLIEHPVHGNILFDTGCSERFYEVTSKWPAKLTALLLPTVVKPEESAKAQLAAKGIAPEDINYIIVSHFHVDHICGLKDFPNARFVCSAAALENARSSKGWSMIKKGVIPDLLPNDLVQRSWIFDKDKNVSVKSLDVFESCFDLFGDDSIRLVALPGHHTGQFGAILKDASGTELFLCADACWLSDSYRENRLPPSLAKLLISDWKAYKNTIGLLHNFYKKFPEIAIVPTHCRKTHDALGLYAK